MASKKSNEYKKLQKNIKELKIKGLIAKSFKLSQSADILKMKVDLIKMKQQSNQMRIARELREITNKYLSKRSSIFDEEKNITKTLKLNKFSDILTVFRNLKPTDEYIPVLKFSNGKYYALTNKTRSRILTNYGNDSEKDIKNDFVETIGLTVSDEDVKQKIIKPSGNIQISFVDTRLKRKKEGSLFKYTHNMNADFERYQIYTEDMITNYKNNCFIHSVLMWGECTEVEIDYIKTLCKNNFIPQSKFKDIVEKVDITINVKRPRTDKNGATKITRYGNGERVLNIGLIDDHYFLIEKTNITSYAIKNYDSVKDQKDWNYIYKSRSSGYSRDKSKVIDSYALVITLLNEKEKRLNKIDCNGFIMHTSEYANIKKEIATLEYGPECARVHEFKDKSLNKDGVKKAEPNLIFFDFETTTDGDKHIPYLCSCYENGEVRSFRGTDCGKQFLNSITKDSLIIVHNLGYDISFLLKYMFAIDLIRTSMTKVMSGRAMFKNYARKKTYKLEFRCSYAMTSSPLSSFANMFKLGNVKKEILPYDLYTRENVKKSNIEISEALKYLKEFDKEEFLNNLKTWDLIDGDKFDHLRYSEIYCESDVKVTYQGYNKFREWMLKITDLDIINYVSIASVGDAYLKKSGCYDDCYEFSGVVREYLQKFVVGGRTMCANNEKMHIQKELADFDAVSLYPSAMHVMKGFLKGVPKVLNSEQLNYDFVKSCDGYFIEIDVTKVNIKRQFPLLNNVDKNGIRNFSNDLCGVHHVDKTTLEDLIKFQGIEFNIIRGYYFNEGYNNKVNKVIEHLFNERIKAKADKNPIQAVFKLLLNSSYGKSIMKPHATKEAIINKDKMDSYIKENYNYIIECMDIHDSQNVIIKTIQPINEHFNSAHIGSSILAESKRIMNKVMCLAEDNGYNIYYQDTDSMHIENKFIGDLAEKYKNEYGSDLIGKHMGQFHSDFDFKSEKEVIATESYFLGKKCYVDKIELWTNGEKHYDYHIRMKGVPSSVVKQTAEDYGGEMELYKHLYDGNSVSFNLLAGSKPIFKGDRAFNVRSLREDMDDVFTRNLKF